MQGFVSSGSVGGGARRGCLAELCWGAVLWMCVEGSRRMHDWTAASGPPNFLLGRVGGWHWTRAAPRQEFMYYLVISPV